MQDDRDALRKTFTPTFHSRFCKLRLQDERRQALRTAQWITAGWSNISRVQPWRQLPVWGRATDLLGPMDTHSFASQADQRFSSSLRDAIWNCNYHVKDKMREQTGEKDHQIFLCLRRLFPFQPCLIFYRGLFLVQRTALVTFWNSSRMIIISMQNWSKYNCP